MEIKKRGLLIFIISLLSSVSVFAQSFGFGSRGANSGVYNAISNALDIIFGGIVTPIFDSISLNNFEASVKVALWIILYLILSNLLNGYLSKMEAKSAKKFSKVIAALIALLGVAFIPRALLETIFRNLLGGILGLLLILAVTIYPIYLLYNFSKDGDKAKNLAAALGFLLLLVALPYLHDELVFALTHGAIQAIASLAITFGIIAVIALMFHRAFIGFKGMKSEEGSDDAPQRPERDEFGEISALANQTIHAADNLRSQMDQLISDSQTDFMNDVLNNPDMLNFANRQTFHPLYQHVKQISNLLEKVNKNKGKAKQISKELAKEYNDLYTTLGQFSNLRNALLTHVRHQRKDMRFFSQVHHIMKTLDHDLGSLSKTLHKVNSL